MNTEFSLDSTLDRILSLDDFRGKKLVLYFYPKDNTSGCTTEALEFSELYENFKALDTEVVGISRDSIRTHKNFKKKHSIPFILLSDPQREIHKNYGILKDKKMYGKDVVGTVRSTFIFDESGELIKEFRDVKAKGHAAKVLQYIKDSDNE